MEVEKGTITIFSIKATINGNEVEFTKVVISEYSDLKLNALLNSAGDE